MAMPVSGNYPSGLSMVVPPLTEGQRIVWLDPAGLNSPGVVFAAPVSHVPDVTAVLTAAAELHVTEAGTE